MITFGDIMTRGLIYYDSEYKEKCKEFCRIRNISYLPHIDNPSQYFQYDPELDRLKQLFIPEEQIVQADESIFTYKIFEDFNKYKILFVKRGRMLEGVVHFSDYNRSIVYDYVYQRLNRLERGIIQLIVIRKKLTKNDLRRFLGKKPLESHKGLLEESDFRAQKKPSGYMNLRDILFFALEHKIIAIREDDGHKINMVRNKVAHSGWLVDKNNGSEFDYKITSFKSLASGMASLEVAIKQVLNRLYFETSLLGKQPSSPVMSLDSILMD
ncbi:MAG: hypothetical protein AAFU33_03195 [Bacteroidota bacterium]